MKENYHGEFQEESISDLFFTLHVVHEVKSGIKYRESATIEITVVFRPIVRVTGNSGHKRTIVAKCNG